MSQGGMLSTRLGKLVLKNPIILGSSGLTRSKYGIEAQIKKGYGAIVTKTVTKAPRAGAPHPTVFWYDPEEKTLLSAAEGLRNPGCDEMADSIHQALGFAERMDCKIIASLCEQSVEGMVWVAKRLQQAGAHAIELNFICPTVGPHLGDEYAKLGPYWSEDPVRAVDAICAVKESVSIPVWPKVRPNNLVKEGFLPQVDAKAKPDAYCFGGGGMPCLVIDVKTGNPIIPGNVRVKWEKGIPSFPSVSGPSRTIAILYTAYVAKLTHTPIVSIGGYHKGTHVVEALMVGASAAGVCTTVYREIGSCQRMLDELKKFFQMGTYSSVEEIKGISLQHLPPVPILTLPGLSAPN